jgi:tetratricopeptide (TPR) repeat protein
VRFLTLVRLRQRAVLAAALICGALSGCATFHPSDLTALQAVPRQASVPDVPFYPQKDKFCGPAALAMAVTWAGAPLTQDEAAALTFTPGRDGTFRSDMETAARRHGLLAVRLRNLEAVLKEVAAGRPVIIFQNLGLSWVPRWHYAVLTGYDLDRKWIVMHSGKDETEVLGVDLFERTWRRADNWALVVLPPDTLPVAAAEADVLDGATGLERVKATTAAAQAYQAIVGRWPQNWAAYFGLGNLQFANGAYPAAEQAFRRALAIKPGEADIWNNLAYALAGQGKSTEAVKAARQAVAEAPGDKAVFERTLAELTDEATH